MEIVKHGDHSEHGCLCLVSWSLFEVLSQSCSDSGMCLSMVYVGLSEHQVIHVCDC